MLNSARNIIRRIRSNEYPGGACVIVMTLQFLFIFLISNGYTLLVTFTPYELPRTHDLDTISAILLLFNTKDYQTVSTAVSLLRYNGYNFRFHYDFEEYTDRLLPLVEFVELHDVLFSSYKLLVNPRLAAKIFIKGRPYGGDLLQLPGRRHEEDVILSFDNLRLHRALFEYVVEQLESMETLQWLHDYLQKASYREAMWLFIKILGTKEVMLPQILSVFKRCYPSDPNFLNRFFGSRGETATILTLRIMTALVTGRERYFTSNLINDSIIDRAIERLSGYKCVKSQKIIFLAQNLFRTTQIALDSEFLALLDSLERTALENLNLQRSVWAVHGSIVIASYMIYGLSNEARLEKTVTVLQHANHLPPLIKMDLIRKAMSIIKRSENTSIYELLVNVFVGLTAADVPQNMRPLGERIEMWIHRGPLLAVARDSSISDTDGILTVIDEAIECATLPLNMHLQIPILDYRGQFIINIGDAIIHEAHQILNSGELYYFPEECFQCTQEAKDLMSVIITSFCYLLAEGRKLDLSFLIPDHIENWSQFAHNIGDNCCDGVAEDISSFIFEMIRIFRLSDFFFPREVRTLIDSSSSQSRKMENKIKN